ncbi:hypothetical protein AZE42_12420 [Rhizopogon vesiculosus]|uniref:Uncharacterized protein n=1 Tax=Rhizopogon vesiculosus TaxID=180088 RepID=A0A1J8Q8Q9_9AGAM|nr:hypothetical protein AZE42_12420 [Rhizopogon vesiculosus]
MTTASGSDPKAPEKKISSTPVIHPPTNSEVVPLAQDPDPVLVKNATAGQQQVLSSTVTPNVECVACIEMVVTAMDILTTLATVLRLFNQMCICKNHTPHSYPRPQNYASPQTLSPLAYIESPDLSKVISQQDPSEKSTIAPREVTSFNNLIFSISIAHFDLFSRLPSAIL